MDNQSQFFYSSIFKISISPKNYHFSSLDWAFKLICEKSGFTPDDLIEVDHIIPKSKGGKDEFNNLQALHRHCHDVKSKNDYLYDWLENGYEWKDDVLTVPMTKD